MDLSRDWLTVPGDVKATPCRWLVNIHHCRDSAYYVVGTAIVLACSALSLIMVVFFILRRRLYLDIQRGISRWSHLLLLSLLFGIGLAFFVTHAILLLVDPPMSFWSRELIRSLAYLFLFTGPVPHVIHLVSLVGRTDMDTIHYGLTKRSTQVLAYTIPLVLAVGGSLSVIAYWEIDLGNPVAYRWFYTSACILYLYPCVVILWFYQAYGIRFADIIDAHLEESGSRSVRRARSMGMMKHLDPFPDRTAVVSYSLQKIKLIYSSVMIAIIWAIIILIILASAPNDVYSIEIFSEIMFFGHYICTSLGIFCTMLFLLVLQLKDRRAKKDTAEDASRTAASHEFPWNLPEPPNRTSGDNAYAVYQPWERDSPRHSFSNIG